MAAWSKIVDYRNLCLEKKIVYPIVDRLLAKSTKLSSRKCRVKRRKLISIADGSIDSPSESVVVFLEMVAFVNILFPLWQKSVRGL